ncbi:MAG: phosphoribosyltransferase [Firmicutes bacterium]|nr:phosphoribosyltransferase [Bacillota bacterium]
MFKDRHEAGTQLAGKLSHLAGRNAVILALPRGGVPVGRSLADILGSELDVIVTRKLGAPHNAELAIGAVCEDGTRILNTELIRILRVPQEHIQRTTESELEEMRRRLAVYRGGRPAIPLAGRIAVVTDDGVATGFTMLAALRAVRRQKPAKLIMAVPVAAPEALQDLREAADEVVCLHAPPGFAAVGEHYQDFSAPSDEEVKRQLEERGSTLTPHNPS